MVKSPPADWLSREGRNGKRVRLAETTARRVARTQRGGGCHEPPIGMAPASRCMLVRSGPSKQNVFRSWILREESRFADHLILHSRSSTRLDLRGAYGIGRGQAHAREPIRGRS